MSASRLAGHFSRHIQRLINPKRLHSYVRRRIDLPGPTSGRSNLVILFATRLRSMTQSGSGAATRREWGYVLYFFPFSEKEENTPFLRRRNVLWFTFATAGHLSRRRPASPAHFHRPVQSISRFGKVCVESGVEMSDAPEAEDCSNPSFWAVTVERVT